MSDEADHTRRWLINAGAAAVLAGTLPPATSLAQTAAEPAAGARTAMADDPFAVSDTTAMLADHVAATLDRELPPEVVARAKLHILDTFAAMV